MFALGDRQRADLLPLHPVETFHLPGQIMPGPAVQVGRRVAGGAAATRGHLLAVEPKLDRPPLRRPITDLERVGCVDRKVYNVFDFPGQPVPANHHQLRVHVTVVGVGVRIRHDPAVAAVEGPGGNLQPPARFGHRASAAPDRNTRQCERHLCPTTTPNRFDSHNKPSSEKSASRFFDKPSWVAVYRRSFAIRRNISDELPNEEGASS